MDGVIAVWALAPFVASPIINIEQRRTNAALLHAWDVHTPAKGKMMEFKAVCAFPFRELKAPESCVGKQRPANFGAMF